MAAQEPKRVLIVDDDPVFRTLIRSLLEDAGFTIAGEAANGAEGVELVGELEPDLVTMDLEMPVLDGPAAVARICERGCPPIVIVSGSRSSDKIGAALRNGARWHVSKRDVVAQLALVAAAVLAA